MGMPFFMGPPLIFKQLIAVLYALGGRIAVIQFLPFGYRLREVSAQVRPAAAPLYVRQGIVALVAVRFQIALEAFQEIRRVKSGPGLRIFI